MFLKAGNISLKINLIKCMIFTSLNFQKAESPTGRFESFDNSSIMEMLLTVEGWKLLCASIRRRTLC